MAAAFGRVASVSGLEDALGRGTRRRGGARRAVARGAASKGARRHRRSTRGARRAHPDATSTWPGSAASARPTSMCRAAVVRLGRYLRRPQRAVGHRLRLRVLAGRAGAGEPPERVALLLEPAARGRLQRRASRLRSRRLARRICARPARQSWPCRRTTGRWKAPTPPAISCRTTNWRPGCTSGFVRQPDLDNFQIWLRRPS